MSHISYISSNTFFTVVYLNEFKFFFTVPKSIGLFTIFGYSINPYVIKSTGSLNASDIDKSISYFNILQRISYSSLVIWVLLFILLNENKM